MNARGVDVAAYQEDVVQRVQKYTGEGRQAQSNGVRQTNGPNSQAVENANGEFAIEMFPDGRKYVRADRQVISGNDPDVWKRQVYDYINSEIRNNRDVVVYAADGDELTISEDTAGKARFRNDVRLADGTTRPMTDGEFAAKLRAETHIDELAAVSVHGKNMVPDAKNHPFAKDGFNYRTAYFLDNDGAYYKLTISVGKNGSINTIYNVGKMKETDVPLSGSKAVAQRSTTVGSVSNSSISNPAENVNNEKWVPYYELTFQELVRAQIEGRYDNDTKMVLMETPETQTVENSEMELALGSDPMDADVDLEERMRHYANVPEYRPGMERNSAVAEDADVDEHYCAKEEGFDLPLFLSFLWIYDGGKCGDKHFVSGTFSDAVRARGEILIPNFRIANFPSRFDGGAYGVFHLQACSVSAYFRNCGIQLLAEPLGRICGINWDTHTQLRKTIPFCGDLQSQQDVCSRFRRGIYCVA